MLGARETLRVNRSKHAKPELMLRSALHRLGYRFRLHREDLPGKPDIVLPKYKTIIDVRGCFWHRHPDCKKATTPSTNTSYWAEKFRRNVQRDKENQKKLGVMGWNVIVVWECEINNMNRRIKRLQNEIRKGIKPNDLANAGKPCQ